MEINKSAKFSFIAAIIGIGLLAMVLLYTGVSWDVLKEKVMCFDRWSATYLFTATLLMVLCLGSRWKVILCELTGIKRAIRGYCTYYCSLGLLLNSATLPHIGNYSVKVGSLSLLYHVPLRLGSLSVMTEQLFELMVLLIFAFPAFLFFTNVLTKTQGIGFAILISTFFIFLFWRLHRSLYKAMVALYRMLYYLYLKFTFKDTTQLKADTLSLSKIQISYFSALKILLYSYGKYLFAVLRVYIIIKVLGINLDFYDVFFAVPIVFLAGIMIPTPATLGAAEVGWLGALSFFGVDRLGIGSFLVLERVVNLAILALVCMFSYFYYALNVHYRGSFFSERVRELPT